MATSREHAVTPSGVKVREIMRQANRMRGEIDKRDRAAIACGQADVCRQVARDEVVELHLLAANSVGKQQGGERLAGRSDAEQRVAGDGALVVKAECAMGDNAAAIRADQPDHHADAFAVAIEALGEDGADLLVGERGFARR